MATVSIEFEVRTSGNGMSKMIVDADALRKAMRMNVEEARRMEDGFFKLAAMSTTFQGVTAGIATIYNRSWPT